MFTIISIVFAAVLTNGKDLSVACVFFIVGILDMFLIDMYLGESCFRLYFYTTGL